MVRAQRSRVEFVSSQTGNGMKGDFQTDLITKHVPLGFLLFSRVPLICDILSSVVPWKFHFS